MDINNLIRGHSKAMFSSWYHYKPDSLLFDCGEGACLALEGQVFAVNTICITHGHHDHIVGLPGFFFARSAARGDNAKPLTVVYPRGDRDIPRLREFIEQSFMDNTGPKNRTTLKFKVTWKEVDSTDVIPLPGYRWLRTFATKHDPTRPSIGYEIMEARKKLKAEYVGLPANEIREKVLAGVEVSESVPRRVLVYSGDTTIQDLEVFEGAELVIHEATFVNKDDVKYDTHCLVDDVLSVMAKRKPQELLLTHFSSRYSAAICGGAVRTKCKEMNITFPVWVQFGEFLFKAYDPVEVTKDGIEEEDNAQD